VEPNELFPSLIKCLDTGEHGFYLDLPLPVESPDGADPGSVDSGPFSKRIRAHVKTGGKGSVAPVLLVMQRNCYSPVHSPVPINNRRLEKAWQNAWAFHGSNRFSKKPIILKDQVSPAGELRAFAPLFYCRHTRQWFHPVCPQCGTALTLCRDDDLLKKRGVPGYSDSLSRFLYCESCSKLSDSAPLFTPQKAAGMPAVVHDKDALVLQWKALLDRLPEGVDLPCRGCPERNDCYATGGRVTGRIVPFAFFPFFFMVLPAPAIGAFDFLRAVSGDAAVALPGKEIASPASKMDRFFFQGEDRQLLEILYLKLTFLQQVVEQIAPVENSDRIQEFDFSLDSIGVDLTSPGAGLPAYWNFTVQMIDSVGSFQASPFAPAMPEGLYLHFLGAVWFHTLLVNSHRGAEDVMAKVSDFLNKTDASSEMGALEAALAETDSLFLGRQIHWNFQGEGFPRNWDEYWRQALQLGFQLVRAGTTAGTAWSGPQFCESLANLREKIKLEMFSERPVAMPAQQQPGQSERLRELLGHILEKWQAQADTPDDMAPTAPPDVEETVAPASPAAVAAEPASVETVLEEQQLHPEPPEFPAQAAEPSDWDDEIEETVVLTATDAMPPPGAPPTTTADSPWDDDIQETVVLQGGNVPPPSQAAAPEEEADQTVVITPASNGSPAQSDQPDADLDATMVQSGAQPPSGDSAWQDADQDATVVINAGTQAPVDIAEPSEDDELAATLIQGAEGGTSPKAPTNGAMGGPAVADFTSNPDLEATMVIKPTSQTTLPPAPSSKDDDEDLEATLIETPRSSDQRTGQKPPAQPGPPQPPQQPTASNDPGSPAADSADGGAEDDDIMEQTVIIRSEVKKE